jgi:hypothetical protein
VTADQTLYATEAVLVVGVIGVCGLWLLMSWLRRRRPGLRIGAPIACALGLRLIAAGVLSTRPLGSTLRAGDESGFIQRVHALAEVPFTSDDWIYGPTSALHAWLLAAEIRLFDAPEFALRVSVIVIAVAGLVLLAAAVHELAGARASRLAAWLMALEPSSLFFSGLLHKEALMLLAEGLVAFGGASMWRRASLAAAAPMAAGALIALATRPYAGWFLIAVSAAIALHASIRASARLSARGVPLFLGALLLVVMTAPIAFRNYEGQLDRLQSSQEAGAVEGENLRLEPVDFSSPRAVVTNLPIRIRDISLRPYPWQRGNTRQRLGLLGTLFALVGIGFLIPAVIRSRHELIARAGPLIYLFMFLLTAYALATSNAGTGFRYRTHLVAIGICLVVVLRAWNRWAAQAAAHHLAEPSRRELALAR